MTDGRETARSVALLREAAKRIAHQMNNATNGVAVNLEVVRARAARTDADNSLGPFADRAAEQLQQVVALEEVVRTLLDLLVESADDGSLDCALSASGDSFEITFPRATIARSARTPGTDAFISLRNGPHGVILTVPRDIPSQVPTRQ